MPHVLPAEPTAAQPNVPEGEHVARALALAREGDVAGTVRSLGAIPDEDQRTRVAVAFVRVIEARDLRTASAVAQALAPGPAHAAAIAAVADAMARGDAAGALTWAVSLPTPVSRRLAAQAIIGRLMNGEAAGAVMERVLALPDGAGRDEAVALAAAQWVQRDPAAAVAWLRARSHDEILVRLTSAIGFALAQVAPEQAVAVADTLPVGRDRWLLLNAIGQTWVAQDRRRALAWARQLPAGEARDAALSGIETGLGGHTSHRPGAAVFGPPASASGLGGRIAGSTGSSAPGQRSEDAIGDSVRKLSAENPAGAAQMLAGLPPGPERNRAFAAYMEQALRNPLPVAADQVRLLPEPDLRDRMTEELARQWLRTNPAAAEAWLLGTGLPPDRKEWLLREVGR